MLVWSRKGCMEGHRNQREEELRGRRVIWRSPRDRLRFHEYKVQIVQAWSRKINPAVSMSPAFYQTSNLRKIIFRDGYLVTKQRFYLSGGVRGRGRELNHRDCQIWRERVEGEVIGGWKEIEQRWRSSVLYHVLKFWGPFLCVKQTVNSEDLAMLQLCLLIFRHMSCSSKIVREFQDVHFPGFGLDGQIL